MGKKILKFSLDIIIIACLVAAGYFGLKIFERFQEDQQLNSSYESIRKDTKTGKHINWNKLKKDKFRYCCLDLCKRNKH